MPLPSCCQTSTFAGRRPINPGSLPERKRETNYSCNLRDAPAFQLCHDAKHPASDGNGHDRKQEGKIAKGFYADRARFGFMTARSPRPDWNSESSGTP